SARAVFAAGPVLSNGKVARRNAAALDLTTGQPTSWDPSVDGELWSLLAHSNSVYLGGSFVAVGDQPIFNLAQVSATSGALVNDWVPDPDGPVFALAWSSSGQVLAGGGFTEIGSQFRGFIAALDASGLAT